MISFRYYIVTIVAIFVALALGVVMGTTVIDQGLVDRLESQTAEANATAARARERAEVAEGGLRRERDLASTTVADQIRDRLPGFPFVVVTDDGTDGPTVGRVTGDLGTAGAEVQAVISTTPRLALEDEGARGDLAQILSMPRSSSVEELRESMTRTLGERLAAGPRPSGDVLFDLMEGGFLAGGEGQGLRKGPEDTFPGVGGPGQSIVFVSGGGPQPHVVPTESLAPMAEAAIDRGAAVAVVEPAVAPNGLVVPIRNSVDAAFLSVDNVDESPGSLSLILGLEELLTGGDGGAYGFKDGADAPYPSQPA